MTDQSEPAPEQTNATVISCGESIDITTVMTWRDKLLEILSVAPDVVFEAESVEKIDTAGLQVLVAFMKDARVKGLSVTWSNPSDVLCRAAMLTGFADVLELPTAV